MREDRLMVLHTMLHDIAADNEARSHFNLQQWVGEFDSGTRQFQAADHDDAVVKRRRKDGCLTVEPRTCGFAACAIGWAATLPAFNRQGLCLARHGSVHGLEAFIDVVNHKTGEKGWSAVESFFDLTQDQARRIFSPSKYLQAKVMPLDVAQRIEEVIDNVMRVESEGVPQ